MPLPRDHKHIGSVPDGLEMKAHPEIPHARNPETNIKSRRGISNDRRGSSKGKTNKSIGGRGVNTKI
jgi:hypothetical protein